MQNVTLVRRSKYVLPLTHREVVKGQSIELSDIEWDKVKNLGLFMQNIPGLATGTGFKEPDVHLPIDWLCKNICIKIVGGVGDTVIVSGLVNALKTKACRVTMAVRPHMMSMVSSVEGVDKVMSAEELNDRSKRGSFDVVLDLNRVFRSGGLIINQDYYTACYDLVKLPLTDIHTSRLLFNTEKYTELSTKLPDGGSVIAIHAGSTNPIRRWPDEYWEKLSHMLNSRGCGVLWLGLGDFWRGGPLNVAAEHVSTDLLDQAMLLHACSYFIGNDSGFAHLAGIMNIPGKVIFSATEPKHVIGRYPKLSAIELFSEMEMAPSRKLTNDDPHALEMMHAIIPEKVLCSIPTGLMDNKIISRGVKKVKVQPNAPIIKQAPIGKHPRVLWVFPHMIMGGGERVVISLIRDLQSSMVSDATWLRDSGRRVESTTFKDELKKVLNGSLHNPHLETEVEDMVELVRAEPYDLIVMYGWSDTSHKALIRMTVRPPIVRISHTSSPQEITLLRSIRKDLHGVVCVAPDVANQVDGVWIPNSVDESRFKSGEVHTIRFDNTFPTLGYIGRVDSAKGIHWVVGQLAKGDFNLVVVGIQDSVESASLSSIATDLGVRDRLKLVEATTNVEPWYRGIDAYVLVSNSEGMPLGVLEAAHCGKPSIATRVGALPHMFKDLESIYFVGKHNEDDFVQAVKQIKLTGRDVGAKAKQLVDTHYSAKVQVRKYYESFLLALGNTWPKEVTEGTVKISRDTGVGDIVMGLSVCDKAKLMFPKAKIAYEVPKHVVPLIKNHPSVDIATCPEKKLTADTNVVLDYYDCWKRNEHAITAMGGRIEDPKLYLDSTVVAGIRKELQPMSVGFWMYQSPNSAVKNKEWPEDNWEWLAQELSALGCTCYQLGALFEKKADYLTDLRKESVLDSVNTLDAVDVVVTIDCMAQHVRHALGKKAVVLWGGGTSPKTIGYVDHANVVTKSKKHCFTSVCVSTYKSSTCCGDLSCIKEVDKYEVLREVTTTLNKLTT